MTKCTRCWKTFNTEDWTGGIHTCTPKTVHLDLNLEEITALCIALQAVNKENTDNKVSSQLREECIKLKDYLSDYLYN